MLLTDVTAAFVEVTNSLWKISAEETFWSSSTSLAVDFYLLSGPDAVLKSLFPLHLQYTINNDTCKYKIVCKLESWNEYSMLFRNGILFK